MSWRCLACRRSTYRPNVALSPPPQLVFRLPANAGLILSPPTLIIVPVRVGISRKQPRGGHESGYAHSYPPWRGGGPSIAMASTRMLIKKEVGSIHRGIKLCILQMFVVSEVEHRGVSKVWRIELEDLLEDHWKF